MKSVYLSVVVFGFSLIGICAAEAEWKAGLASIKITPERPVPLSGYASRVKPFERVEQDLYAKALALEDNNGRRAVLVTTDLIGLSKQIVEPIWAELESKTTLGRDRIIFSASHTHSGPLLRRSNLPTPGVRDEDADEVAAYTRRLQTKLTQLVVDALAKLEPAELSWGTGISHFAMNRREFTDRGVILGVNPKGPVDRSVPVLRVNSESGDLRAVVFGYACHNTTLTHTNYAVCGDYAGFAQQRVQEQFPNVQAMFVAGCGGDANPHPRGTMELAREHGGKLGEEVCRILASATKPVRGPLRCAVAQVDLPLQSPPRPELQQMAGSGPSWQAPAAKQMLAALDRGETLASTYSTPVAVWQFGDDLTFVGLPGEVVVDYVQLLEKSVGPLRLWTAAYCNDVFGYLPSARVLNEGGYECRGLYTAQGFFAPNAQDVMAAKVRELAEQAGRNVP